MAKSRAKSKAQIDRMSWPAQQRRYAFLGSIAPGSWDGKLDAELAYLESSLASGDYEPKASRLTWTSKNNGWEHHAKGGGYSFIIREHPEDFGEFFTLEQFRGSRPVGDYEDMHTLAEAKKAAQRAVDADDMPRKTTARGAKRGGSSLAKAYDSYRKNWKQSPRLVARFNKGKLPPRS